jgi:hypothetical protein
MGVLAVLVVVLEPEALGVPVLVVALELEALGVPLAAVTVGLAVRVAGVVVGLVTVAGLVVAAAVAGLAGALPTGALPAAVLDDDAFVGPVSPVAVLVDVVERTVADVRDVATELTDAIEIW